MMTRVQGLVTSLVKPPRERGGADDPYFYCLGRQKDANDCQQGYVAVERVEAAVTRHWDSYRLSDERRAEVWAAVVALFRTRTAGAEKDIAAQQARVALFGTDSRRPRRPTTTTP
jgi:hypothetical protein